MKKSIWTLLPILAISYSSSIFGLDIDEKLTLRFLKVSSSQKTVLINRGGEDGLVVGDHAKFFITAGVVARGVVEKVSPTRSVWSLYRVVDPSEITQDKVLNLKISSPVKITDDPSKSLKEEPIPGGSETMSMGDEVTSVNNDEMDSSEKEVVITDEDQNELRDVGLSETKNKVVPNNSKKKNSTSSKSSNTENNNDDDTNEVNTVPVMSSSFRKKTWDVVGSMNFNSLWYTSDDVTTSASPTGLDLGLALEKYFYNSNNFFKDFSLFGFIHKTSMKSDGSLNTNDYFEYGLGLNYHFYNRAYHVNRIIGFGTFAIGAGSVSTETVSTVSTTSASDTGSNSFFSLGAGAKYLFIGGFGMRALVDFYSSSESRELDDLSTTDTSLSGVRLQLGLSYRF
ncbi:MAG: hypothetical protein HOP07_17225 [Bacteriovoracaceae bacterium]|nr:hypothetical protein [Bacteriovoracaceae bacterium]